jgi:hypothetical protein
MYFTNKETGIFYRFKKDVFYKQGNWNVFQVQNAKCRFRVFDCEQSYPRTFAIKFHIIVFSKS